MFWGSGLRLRWLESVYANQTSSGLWRGSWQPRWHPKHRKWARQGPKQMQNLRLSSSVFIKLFYTTSTLTTIIDIECIIFHVISRCYGCYGYLDVSRYYGYFNEWHIIWIVIKYGMLELSSGKLHNWELEMRCSNIYSIFYCTWETPKIFSTSRLRLAPIATFTPGARAMTNRSTLSIMTGLAPS